MHILDQLVPDFHCLQSPRATLLCCMVRQKETEVPHREGGAKDTSWIVCTEMSRISQRDMALLIQAVAVGSVAEPRISERQMFSCPHRHAATLTWYYAVLMPISRVERRECWNAGTGLLDCLIPNKKHDFLGLFEQESDIAFVG
jgi:hypothetical protein